MKWNIEIKHDTRHRKWHRLSVSMKEPWSTAGRLHACQWAIDNQANPDQVAFRLVCDETGEKIPHMSYATANRP